MHRATIGLALAMGACFAYRPVETAPAPGARVRLILTSASDVTTAGASGVREVHPGILEIHGTIQASAADTIAVRLGELRSATGTVGGLEGRSALIAAERVARIEQRRFQAGNTALAGIGVATLALGTFLIVIIVAITQGF